MNRTTTNKNSVQRKLARLEKEMRFTSFVPNMRQPTVNRTVRFPMRVTTGITTSEAATQLWRIEDLIKVVAETIAMGTTWYEEINIQVQRIQAYAVLDSINSPFAVSLTAAWHDPVTGANIKMAGAVGDLDDPPRVGLQYPVSVSEHPFGWNGTAGSSAKLVTLTTSQKAYLTAYYDIVVTVYKVSLTAGESCVSVTDTGE